MLNTITLSGRLTNKSEGSFRKRITKDGTKIFGTSIAVERWNGKESVANFFPIVGFNRLAEALDRVAVGGRVTLNATPQIQTSQIAGMNIDKTVFKVNSLYIIDFKEANVKKDDAATLSKSEMHEAIFGETYEIANAVDTANTADTATTELVVDGSDW